ncbi:MAG: hypothetical protein KDC95_11535 [Planctomycetes bacterium]|nr:hypothetical protein [Planctomycetota bacterium]
MFIRFVVVEPDTNDHRLFTGLIARARILRDDGELDQVEVAVLERVYDWFNRHLPVPPYGDAWPRNCAAWFKSEATEAISAMWELYGLLQRKGVEVRMIKSKHPGKIVYEDDQQVVVQEWSSL